MLPQDKWLTWQPILEQHIKMCLQWEFDLKKEVAIVYNFVFCRCTTPTPGQALST
jgi:hypothetical protein